MQLEIALDTVLIGNFLAICLLFTLYLILRICAGPNMTRPERRGGTPRVDDLTATQSAYGHETSYSSSIQGCGSSAGPFPIGGRTERLPTRSFGSYTKPRRKSKKG